MRPTHWIIVILVALIIFGASKLPDIARSLGQSAKILKKEMRELQDDNAQPQPGQQPNLNAPQQVPGQYQTAPPPQGQQPPPGWQDPPQQYGYPPAPDNGAAYGYPPQSPGEGYPPTDTTPPRT